MTSILVLIVGNVVGLVKRRTVRQLWRNVQFVLAAILVGVAVFVGTVGADDRCVPEQRWLIPEDGSIMNDADVLTRISKKKTILLGEHHQNLAHHQWHLAILEALYQRLPKLELAIEMLPRSAQGALDRWVAGELTEEEFMGESGWDDYWFYDIDLYLPVFHFARRHQIPIHALNVDRALSNNVSEKGWNAILPEERGGLGDPARPPEAYLYQLAQSFRRHTPATPSAKGGVAAEEGAKFLRFIEVQLLWDRSMAEGIVNVSRQAHHPVVVGIMGSGHIINRLGTAYQLADLGADDIAILVPWDDHLDCKAINPEFADAIFGAKITGP